MAINKKQTSLLTKVVLVFISLAFVGVYIPGLFAGVGSSSTTTTGPALGSLEYIAEQHSSAINYYDELLASEPTSYTVLLSQAYEYHNWAGEVQQTTAAANGADRPMWIAASDYYERALAVTDGDPGVRTDLAICYFYSGNTALAIENVEKVMAATPTFASAFFNAGIFYGAAAQDGDSLRVFKRSIELDPEASFVSLANERIAALEADGVIPTVESITSVETTSAE